MNTTKRIYVAVFTLVLGIHALSAFAVDTGEIETIEYQIMVQRATQEAIWAMPAVGIVDFRKATILDLGGTILTKKGEKLCMKVKRVKAEESFG